MARLRLGFLGAILLVLAAFAAQIRPAPAGLGTAASGAVEIALGPAAPTAGHAVASDLWDDPDDDLGPPLSASDSGLPRVPLRLIAAGHADARLARRKPRATGPPHLPPM